MTQQKRNEVVRRMAELRAADPGAFIDYTMDLVDEYGFYSDGTRRPASEFSISELAEDAKRFAKAMSA